MVAALMLCAGCSDFGGRETPVTPQTIHFDSSEIGKVPRDFTTALTGDGGPVLWAVRQNNDAPDGQPILAQESAYTNNYRFPVCVYDKVHARDVAAEVKWKAISGKVDEGGGIVLRYRPENYYIARANALENNVILFVTIAGKRSKIEEVPVKVTAGEWHTIRFEAKGLHLKVMFDGKTVIERDDYIFSNAGKVGLWTKADSVSEFTDFNIEPVE